jgi:hypothetical protein
MDQDRQIRFAIPPFFLFASLLWDAHLSGVRGFFGSLFWSQVLAAAAASIPVGFLAHRLSPIFCKPEMAKAVLEEPA